MTALTSVDNACELVTDGTHFTPPNVGVGVPFLTVKDVSDCGLDFVNCSFITQADFLAAQKGNCAPRPGDVLFSKDGTVGKVHVVTTDRPFAVLSSLAILRPDKKRVDSGYLGHVLRFPAVLNDALKRKTGSAIRRIVLADLKQVQVPLPPLPEQRRIAAILDKADELRAKRRAALEQLSRLRTSAFVSLFGDTRSILNKWKLADLGASLNFLTSGSRGWARHYRSEGALFLRIQNVRRDELCLEDVTYVDAPDTAEAKRTRVQTGDVLLSITADLGRTAVIPHDIGVAYINQHLAILRTQAFAPRFLSAFLVSDAGRLQILGKNRQGVKAGLNFDDIRSLRVPNPPRSVQFEFEQQMTHIDRLEGLCRRSRLTFDAGFASLQHQAFSGAL